MKKEGEMAWTREQDDTLRELWERGATGPECAAATEHTEAAVRMRLGRLGLAKRRVSNEFHLMAFFAERLLQLSDEEQRRVVQWVDAKLSLLYPFLLEKKKTSVGPAYMAEEALTFGVWPLLPQWEANVLVRTHEVRSWMNDANAKGVRNAYKTPKRGRQPFHECKQQELAFDIWQKAKAGEADRMALRSDITNYKLAFGATPSGPDGEKLPSWLWTSEDDRMFDLIEGRKTAPELQRKLTEVT